MNLDWWKRFAKLFRPRVTTLLGIDFGQGSVKVAEVSLTGRKPCLQTLAIVPVPVADWNSTEETPEDQFLDIHPEVLKDMLTKALSLSGARAKNAVLAVGGQLSFMREVTFPRLPADELAEAIKWDIPKYVPYEQDSYEFDYAITGQNPENGDLRVLIVAAPKNIINKLTQVVRAVGLTPLAIDIESMALYRTMTEAENALILDIGAANTQISLFQKGHPVFNRVIQKRAPFIEAEQADTSDNNAELESMADGLAQEIRRTIQFFSQQNKKMNITKVVVTGTNEADKLVALLAPRVELPVIRHDPLEGIRSSPTITADYLREMGPQLSVAIGLALRGDEP